METLKIEEVLKEQGVFINTTTGYSMFPMLRDRKDTIVITPYEGRLKKFDIPLYKVKNRYILHRIIEVLPDGYVIRGDNCEKKEFGITDADILGVLTCFYRGDKEINMNGWKYKLYVRVWYYTFGIRKAVKYLYRKVKYRK